MSESESGREQVAVRVIVRVTVVNSGRSDNDHEAGFYQAAEHT